ncbi:hypothetical protein BDA96_02G293600 [Sorghum bicolor]|uniref:Uncharacterized protein n=2 Tax=Sorghum bicolor TaxID=4558 RepID=A0A921RS14_SORBI|nr:hypothetical protein BDA96_02G293600 [Sorghum bicolor]KXG36085.1 hypothetical protein SORBI_3002G279200 [Sorghum bicolor]
MKGFYVIFWWMWMHYEKELMGQGKDDTVMDGVSRGWWWRAWQIDISDRKKGDEPNPIHHRNQKSGTCLRQGRWRCG